MATTTRLGLRYPILSDSADVPRDIGNLAADIDKAAIFGVGTLASRPVSAPGTPGISGRYYYANDAGAALGDLWFDYGTGYRKVALFTTDDKLYFGADVILYRSAADRLKTDDLIDATLLALATKVKAGTPVDADWATAPPDGTVVADSTTSILWVRIGGAWVRSGGPPTAHVSTHEPGGSDPLPVDAAADTGSLRTLGTGPQQAAPGNDSRILNAMVAEPGDLKWSARQTPGIGWLLCDGTAVSRTTYSALFAAIGTAYGPGDGTTTFNLPDFRGRAPIGVGTHAEVNARGMNDGVAVANRRPRHKHTVNDPQHTHSAAFFRDQQGVTNISSADKGGGNDQMVAIPYSSTGVTIGPQTGAEPTDTAPYLTANCFIKT